MVDIRMAYDDFDLMSIATGLECKDPSLAVQSERDEADINTIVKRFGLTGQLPENVRVPTVQDFEDVFDFQSAMNATIEASKSFYLMPADVRSRFENNPHLFVEFCTEIDDKGKLRNLEEMRKLGLAVPEVVPPPVVSAS